MPVSFVSVVCPKATVSADAKSNPKTSCNLIGTNQRIKTKAIKNKDHKGGHDSETVDRWIYPTHAGRRGDHVIDGAPGRTPENLAMISAYRQPLKRR